MKFRNVLSCIIFSIGFILFCLSMYNCLKTFDVQTNNNKIKMGSDIVFAKMDDSVLAVSISSGKISSYDLNGEFLYSSEVPVGSKNDISVYSNSEKVIISYSESNVKAYAFDKSGYLGKTTDNIEHFENDCSNHTISINDVTFYTKSFGRIFMKNGNNEKQLSDLSLWNCFIYNPFLVFVIPLIGIILLLPSMVNWLMILPHNQMYLKHKNTTITM